MNRIKKYKTFLLIITGIVLFFLAFITYDIISETGDWVWFDIDFKQENEAVSAYGSLIGGILSFLSILFVLYGLLEQRQQIINEKKEKDEDYKIELLDKLKVLSSYLKSTIDDIIGQGVIFREYFQNEKEHPSQMNTMQFTNNKNFTRVIDMDPLFIYKAIHFYFKDDVNWEKIFLNL